MTADEITGWIETLSAAAADEERGRQARMSGGAGANPSGQAASGGAGRSGRGAPSAGIGMALWRGDELQSAKTCLLYTSPSPRDRG